MFSRQETVDAVASFYRQIIKQPYLDDNALTMPPGNGWTPVNSSRQNKRLLVEYETVPAAYTQRNGGAAFMNELHPLPAYCVYLTEDVDREGYSLILDTNIGTVTAFSIAGYEITVDYDTYEALPDRDRWKAHRVLPVTDFFDLWSRKYARLVHMLVPNPIGQPTTGALFVREDNRRKAERLAMDTGPFEEWQPDVREGTNPEEAVRRRYTAV
ncbi:hypothetical protein LTR62_000271 [Meristemomyces frigidus]|uniref:Uncharacterized protein n=1 Tax=Meristemomyces frigidus TaxID=1508187 RepID=A0AAN7TKA1_9PEZI|nr:hypothetical protein LTR62_000271 [Meristemomyces frigidus]